MSIVESEAPIFNQLQVEYLSREIWKKQLRNIKTSKLRRIARDLGIKRYLHRDRWELIDEILGLSYETLDLYLHVQ